ncbi:PadR family transcriptional regulator [Patescibacteria group bacterium]|nr:PadR family transcriptional regulator [Patescibacteria group bacterium]
MMVSNKEATLLGLISEKSKHAYEIENDIKERDMRYWTEISMSSVYKLLNKLEKKNLLKSEVKLSNKNVVQKIYSLTDQGKIVFENKVKELISTWQPSIYPIDISLANLSLLKKEQVIEGLAKYMESLDNEVKCYQELEKFLIDNKCTLGNIQLATRRIYMLKGEKEWLQGFIPKYK